jgi:sugar lactone lactonase YvrE
VAVLCAVAVVAAGCGKSSSDAKLASGTVKRVVGFDGSAHQNSESLAVDANGDTYISWPFLGKVVKIANGTTTVKEIGSVPLAANEFGVLGVALRPKGPGVLATVQSKASGGVWQFKKAGGTPTRIAGTEAIGFPNDLVVADDGTVYVASSAEGKDPSGAFLGAVWRVSKSGAVDKWFESTMLGGTGKSGLPAPIGANGIAFRDHKVYVSVTEQGQILAIPVGGGGKPGKPTIVAKDPQLNGIDGITFDPAGNLFAAIIQQSQIVRVDKDNYAVTVIAMDADGLDLTSSVKFGAGKFSGDLLATNFAVAELLGGHTVEGPALLRIPKAS